MITENKIKQNTDFNIQDQFFAQAQGNAYFNNFEAASEHTPVEINQTNEKCKSEILKKQPMT